MNSVNRPQTFEEFRRVFACFDFDLEVDFEFFDSGTAVSCHNIRSLSESGGSREGVGRVSSRGEIALNDVDFEASLEKRFYDR